MSVGSARALCLAIVLGASCFASATAGPGGGRPAAERVAMRIAGAAGTVGLRAEIARTVEARSRGLMDRSHLPADAGMLFVYPEAQPPQSGFWMFRTRIPLDIAFLDGDGRILAIRVMEPCGSAVSFRCRTYAPGVPYRAALEVNRGFFARNRIAVGDRLVLPPDFSLEGAE
ncbi:hypothetical protein SVA_1235 [Sulfurifustis variabilis]|uniref:DUF192 domain-containing protein n=1 Tax=Sulfurifustis variabilis TaxID=1675686 RepID=A0A1B4V2P8_9GAMM|nr:DUF192 domain-containing protein [Sulfurifustis variabilis]BAU47810.1 hypothetical protein SVA_1235 [Sulfurifustis variabilis]